MHAFGFPHMCWRSIRRGLWKIWLFSCLAPPGGDRAMNFTIKIPLTKEIIHTENGNRPCSFQEEVQKLINVKYIVNGRRPNTTKPILFGIRTLPKK